MEPKSTQDRPRDPKALQKSFFTSCFSYNLHYTKFILCKNSPPLFWSLAARSSAPAGSRRTSGIKKAHPSLCRAQMRGALFIILNIEDRAAEVYSVQVADRAIALGPAVAEQAPFHTGLADGCKVIACGQDGVLSRQPGPGLPRSRRSESWCRKTAARSAGPRFPCTA